MNPALEPVRPGTAEQLARISHFRVLEETQPEELDYVALWLIGDVGSSGLKWGLWEELRDGDAAKLWYLVSDDYDDRDLDELDADDFPIQGPEFDERYQRTRDRLVHQIEERIRLARWRALNPAGAR
jgi:hypothetical protein